jgi:hypothetical protein
MTIQDLNRNDRFIFNDEAYKVIRKWIDDNRPLIAIEESSQSEHRFHHEGLEIVKLQPHAEG